MPSLSVRSLAEMLNLPAHAQARILSEQKHPKQAPQVFRTPYYQQALAGIRGYYRSGNDSAQLNSSITKIEEITQEARRENNLRVLRSFRKSGLAQRVLELAPQQNLKLHVGEVELRLTPDLKALEESEPQIVFVNCRAQVLDPEVAKFTLEIAHWVFEANDFAIPIKNIQYVDLYNDTTHFIAKRRASTIKAVSQNMKIIETLWPSL